MEPIIAKNIKFFLDEKNQTVQTLSDMSKLDYGFVKAVVDGKYMPTVAEIASIAEALDVAVYQLFLPQPNFLSSWHISLEELGDMVAQNPSLRGFMVGYMAESKLRSYFSACPEISNMYKPDDHDRSNKCDLVLSYMEREFTFEIKSLQTNTVKTSLDGKGFEGTF